MSDIQPAVRPSEWKFTSQIASSPEMACKLDADGRVWIRAPNDSGCEEMHEVTSIRLALAAFCLYSQPTGFWQHLPKTLRIAAEKLRVLTDDFDSWGDLDRTADIIESLMPPE